MHYPWYQCAVWRLVVCVLLICVPAVLGAAADNATVTVAVHSMAQAAGALVDTVRSPQTDLVTFVATQAGHPIPLPGLDKAALEDRALAFFKTYGQAFGLRDPAQLRVTRESTVDEVGMEHVRLQQLHQGIPVTAAEITLHLQGAQVVAVLAKTVPAVDAVSIVPTVPPDEARRLTEAFLAKHLGITDATLSSPRLELFNRGLLESRHTPTRLAWFVVATRPDLYEFLWVDAQTGVLLLRFSQLTYARNRRIHNANHGSILPGPLARTEGQPSTGITDIDNAYTFLGDTYDYYFTTHGRDSFDNAGAALVATVRFCDPQALCPYQNAFWNGTQMVFGDGFPAADDVTAHELTHAVTEFSANLFYYMQSGALNESFSDIFGETVDLLNGRGTDTPAVRWLIGEDVPGFGADRNMMNPVQFNDPGKVSDTQFVCTSVFSDNGGVHTNSGVPNHAYALMVDGGTYNGVTITGLGLTKAAKIQYRVLTSYLTSGANFLDNYLALRQSCTDLVGSAGITSFDCGEVTKALDAVEMSRTPCGQPQEPALCMAGQMSTTLFFDDAENGLANWVVTTPIGSPLWSSATGYAQSGTHSFYGQDIGSRADSSLALRTDVAIPAGGARLQFNHSFEFESNSDGGVIEYSTNGGTSWSDAGSLIAAGMRYNSTLRPENPLGGRQAFSGWSSGYTATQLNLASLAGKNVRFRFRVGTDASIGNVGWDIDDVRISQCLTPPKPLRDFNGDGRADILWRHVPSGLLYLWLLDGTASIGGGTPGDATLDWTIADVGDFNGDGRADILWHHTSSGLLYIWLLDGTTVIGGGSPGSAPPLDWTLLGVGDFNGDGRADILWRHAPSGLVYIWLLDGTTVIGGGAPGTATFEATFVDVGDFNGDGRADILWRHAPSGRVGIWLLDGTVLINGGVPGDATLDWTIVDVGDFNGDGRADILWRHASSGLLYIWLLDGTAVIGGGVPGGAPFEWTIVNVDDFNGDGWADILWRHTSSGLLYIWLLDGTAVIGGGTPGGAPFEWEIQ